MRAAVVVSSPVPADLRELVSRGLMPQQDFFALADALDAILIAPARSRGSGRGGKLSQAVQLLRVAWEAFRRRDEYDLVVTDLDRVGLILATLFKLSRSKKSHVLICHGKVSRSLDGRLLKMLRLHTHIHRFVCYGPAVAKRLVERVGVPAHQVATVRHAADHRFWHPLPVRAERLIASAGMLRRDYGTLIEAVRGLDVSLMAAAFSPWVHSSKKGASTALPENVRFTRLTPVELRDLYARALFVAVPLQNSSSQAGSLVVYEAMAMGKPVVVTRTAGEDALGLVKDGETGYFVKPGDVDGWRRTIQHLLDHPQEAALMGQRARAYVEQGLNMQTYVQDMVSIVSSVTGEPIRAEAQPETSRDLPGVKPSGSR